MKTHAASQLMSVMVVTMALVGLLRLAEAQQVQKPAMVWDAAHSSNYTASTRPTSYPIQYIMIHITEGSYAGTISWFKNSASNVSAHYVISKTGHITNMVKDKDIAWTNGNSYYNARGIGIEHEGYGSDPNSWTNAQLNASAQLTAWYCQTYGIPATADRILMHKEVRQTACPGTYFNRTDYINRVNSFLNGGNNNPPAATYNAQLTVHTQPSQLTSGQDGVVWLELKNTGTATWDRTHTSLKLNPLNAQPKFFASWNWTNTNTPTMLDVPNSVAPNETGTFAFVALAPNVNQSQIITEKYQLYDSRHNAAFGPIITVSIQVNPVAGPLTVVTTSLPDGTHGADYSGRIEASGGTPAYTFVIESGRLPHGLTLDWADGGISGMANESGTFAFTVKVTDSNNPAASTTKNLSVTIAAGPNVNNPNGGAVCTMSPVGNPVSLWLYVLMAAFALLLRRLRTA